MGVLLLEGGRTGCLLLSLLPAHSCFSGSQGRRKKVPPDGVKLVDEVSWGGVGGRLGIGGSLRASQPEPDPCLSPPQSLLRQTQLRSLSKSDTKLHELYRVKARDDSECPRSSGFWGVGGGTPHGACSIPVPPSLLSPQTSDRPAWISPHPRPPWALTPCTAPASASSCTASCPKSPSPSPQPSTRPTPTCSSPHHDARRRTRSTSAWQRGGGRTPPWCPSHPRGPGGPPHKPGAGPVTTPASAR